MRKSSYALAATGLVAAVTLSGAATGRKPATRSFEATWVGTVLSVPETAKRVDVWIPLPSDGPYQAVTDVSVDAPVPVTMGKDSAGNRVAHFVLDRPEQLGKNVEVKARYRVARTEAVNELNPDRRAPSDPAAYLAPNRLVPMTPRVKELSDRLSAGKRDAVEKALAFYDYLVDNGTYDKTVPGWGKGDSERFCDLKKGNCTDFHSAFMALARAQKIPVRFFIGFPVASEREGTVPGYHCWAEFWTGSEWVPIDASDAAKLRDPVKKNYLFGNLDPNRFEITTGRDLTLAPPQKDGPLNFFIYPYVEVDGKAYAETKIRLEYRDL
ncbi:MAG TPA: transglutaminase domain-containing protein [Thermoanaerobaculia bacterium]|nr:transglutaminase domain-containing protein [Thermoanaerobaculia bacterium]